MKDETDILAPEERQTLIGHSTAENAFLSAMAQGRLHHAWLVTGPDGVGKATFAFRAARFLLTGGEANAESLEVNPDDPSARQVANLGHPDLLVLRRAYDEKKGRFQAELPVDEARKLGEFFAKTAGRGGWRVAIVDTVDDMNRNAANAILKTLEEPPEKGVIFLLANAPGRLLATIRSRCRRLDLAPLFETDVTTFLQNEASVDAETAARLAALAQGRPGYALRLAEEGGKGLMSLTADVLDAALKGDDQRLFALAETASRKDFENRWRSFADLLTEELARLARIAAGGPPDSGLLPDSAAAAMARLRPAAVWAELWRDIRDLAEGGAALNMDRKQTVLNMGFALAGASRRRA